MEKRVAVAKQVDARVGCSFKGVATKATVVFAGGFFPSTLFFSYYYFYYYLSDYLSEIHYKV